MREMLIFFFFLMKIYFFGESKHKAAKFFVVGNKDYGIEFGHFVKILIS